MNLIDTMAVSFVLENGVRLKSEYYMAPDVKEETKFTSTLFGRRMPSEIRPISDSDFFKEAAYLEHYNFALNEYGTSFYNMTGFGDVSLAASLATVLERMDHLDKQQLFSTSEPIHIYSEDKKLRKHIQKHFQGRDVHIHDIVDLT